MAPEPDECVCCLLGPISVKVLTGSLCRWMGYKDAPPQPTFALLLKAEHGLQVGVYAQLLLGQLAPRKGEAEC